MVTVGPLLELAPDWCRFLARVIREEDKKLLCSHEQTGRPLGGEACLGKLEKKLRRILKKQKLTRATVHSEPSKHELKRPRYEGLVVGGGLLAPQEDRNGFDVPRPETQSCVFYLAPVRNPPAHARPDLGLDATMLCRPLSWFPMADKAP